MTRLAAYADFVGDKPTTITERQLRKFLDAQDAARTGAESIVARKVRKVPDGRAARRRH